MNPHSPSEDLTTFRNALRQWATGITIVTSAYQGLQRGMTVSSFLSISLSPPLLLVSLQKSSRTFEIILKSQDFGVNILSQDQAESIRSLCWPACGN